MGHPGVFSGELDVPVSSQTHRHRDIDCLQTLLVDRAGLARRIGTDTLALDHALDVAVFNAIFGLGLSKRSLLPSTH